MLTSLILCLLCFDVAVPLIHTSQTQHLSFVSHVTDCVFSLAVRAHAKASEAEQEVAAHPKADIEEQVPITPYH